MSYTAPHGDAAHFIATGTVKYPVSNSELRFSLSSAPYVAPAGDDVVFLTPWLPDFPPLHDDLLFRFSGSAWIPPDGDDIAVQFPAPPGPGDWLRPLGNAVDFTALGDEGIAGFTADGAFELGFTVAGTASHGVAGSGAFDLGFDVASEAETAQPAVAANGAFSAGFEFSGEATHITPVIGAGAFSVDFAPAGEAAHGIAGAGSITLDFSPAGTAAHGVAGSGAVSIGFGIAGDAVHERYELRGEVRYQGVLVNRQVRAYRRDTGELIGQSITTAGRFAVPVGFTPAEHYIIPIDPANDAEDFAPPTANRVMSVLAMDAA